MSPKQSSEDYPRPALLVGLTGSLGAGKSVVAGIWRSLGAGVVEGDWAGRMALDQDRELRAALKERFGAEIFRPDGSIDRKSLGRRAFADAKSQRDLTALTFPVLYRIAIQEMSDLALQHRIVVFDAALIYEWGIESDFDRIVVVTATEETLVERAARRLKLSREEIRERLSFQMAPEAKADMADYVIYNDRSRADLTRKAKDIWIKLDAEAAKSRQGQKKRRSDRTAPP